MEQTTGYKDEKIAKAFSNKLFCGFEQVQTFLLIHIFQKKEKSI
jgi:hypothetical protein